MQPQTISSHETDLPQQQRLSAAGLHAFFTISSEWELNTQEEIALLGSPPRSTFFKWKKSKEAELSHDTLERISYIIGIYKALFMLLPSKEAALSWIKRPNNAPLFNGQTALARMCAGNVVDLADVRRYLDAQRG